jgi:hypothetical protein
MEPVPMGSVEVVRLAVLLNPLPGVRVALPSAVVPSVKATEPVGAAYRVENVTVNVTGWFWLEGFCEDTSTALLMKAGLMTWLNAGDVAAPKLPFPA